MKKMTPFYLAAMFITLGIAAPSLAQTQTCPAIQLDAGIACRGFALGIDVALPAHRVEKTFVDKNGNVVRILNAGQGNTLLFSKFEIVDATNNICRLISTFSLNTNGSVERIRCCTDKGEQIWTTTGHNVLILFPTDSPAGPSTNLYSGRLVFLQGATTTLQSVSGSVTDICARLR